MRKLGFTFFTLGLLLSQVLNGQDPCKNGLVFSEAFFIELTAEQSNDYIAIDTTLQVEKGTVWMISDAKAWKIVGNDFAPDDIGMAIWINNQVIHHRRSNFIGPIWLSEGQYSLRLLTDDRNEKERFRVYISGVKYIIEE